MNEAIRLLTSAATPDPEFGDDLEAVRSTELRSRREAFVEMATAAFPPQPFDMLAARIRAGVWADLARRGQEIGAHDVLVAATAMSIGWQVATANVRHFERIPGLEVRAVRLS
ncbi:PIN domain-containing protein [Nocardia canadensis]|uniref:hypothetical protein n=1 Tax=Nocardia canadensis TaxID=3065238 RepID=UPI002931F430|nr:hypothetical protein [Nocardia canadensis]